MGTFHQKPNLYIGEVVIKVENLQRSIEFYKDIIGLKVLSQKNNEAVLTADGKTALLTLQEPEQVTKKSGRTTGLYHFAILLPSRADLSVFLRHLLQKRYPIGAADHLVSEAIYLNDPDGNGIEVYRDRPSSEWTWKNGLVEMATLELDGAGILAETTEPWQGLPSGTIMGHIHLHVADLEAAKRFYTEGLLFNIVSYYPQAVFLSTGGYHHHIAINTWAGIDAPAPSENSVGLAWYTIVYPNKEVRDKAVERLIQLGYEVIKNGSVYTTKDPSGNEIHLVL